MALGRTCRHALLYKIPHRIAAGPSPVTLPTPGEVGSAPSPHAPPGLMRIAGEDMGAAVGVDVAAYYSILGPEGSSAQSGRLEHALYSTHGLSLEARG